jgi:hypothetical protein
MKPGELDVKRREIDAEVGGEKPFASQHSRSNQKIPMVGRRRDRFLVHVPPERALQIAADPTRFPEFNPIIRVPETTGRVEQLGNVYHQDIAVGPVRLSTRWETVEVEPPTLAERLRPALPWTTIEVGRLPLFGLWRSTSRYEGVDQGTVITHDLEYALPDGLAGRVADLVLMRPLLAIGFGFLLRRCQRWIETGEDRSSSASGVTSGR